MIRRHLTALHLALMAADGLSAIVVFIVASVVRFGPSDWQEEWSLAGVEPWLLALAYGVGLTASLWLVGIYQLRSRLSIRTEWADIARATLLVAVLTFAALFLFKLPNVSRLFLIVLFPAQIVVTAASRLVLRSLFSSLRARGYNTRFVLMIGAGPSAEAFADRIEDHLELGLRVVGHLAEIGSSAIPRRPVIGRIEDIEAVLHGQVIDEVAISLPVGAWGYVEPVTRLCADEGKIVRIPLEDAGLTVPGARVEEFDGIAIASLVYGPDRTLALVAKRLFDLSLASIALVILSPVLAMVAAWVRLRDGSGVLFSQVRVGLHGRPFTIHKFRTMVQDAEERYEEVVQLSDTTGPAFKMTNDPRITRTGATLRRLSLDELPQLWNVVRGDMSLVGPRPAPPREVAGYDLWHRRRLSMKPGITGLWQVRARRDEDFDRRASIDLEYIDRWSLLLDFRIIVETVPALVQGR